MAFGQLLTVTEGQFGEWSLALPLTYYGNKDVFTVPAGFETDFASVPRALWGLFPPYGRHTKAAVLHDWLYATQPAVKPDKPNEPARRITRKEADGLFLRTMKELGVSWWRRHAMHRAVRSAGWLYWNKNATQLQTKEKL